MINVPLWAHKSEYKHLNGSMWPSETHLKCFQTLINANFTIRHLMFKYIQGYKSITLHIQVYASKGLFTKWLTNWQWIKGKVKQLHPYRNVDSFIIQCTKLNGTQLIGQMGNYRKISNIRRTKSQHLKDYGPLLRLSLPNPFKPEVKSRMKM